MTKVTFVTIHNSQFTIDYFYNGLDPIADYQTANNVTTATHYLWANGGIAEIVRLPNPATGFPGDRHWTHTDGLGSLVDLTDASGDPLLPTYYDEYGQLLTAFKGLTRYSYTGQEYDAETGLYHFYARYYDPGMGVWLTQDPYRGSLTEPGMLHRYGYVGGNPVKFLDPYGLERKASMINDLEIILGDDSAVKSAKNISTLTTWIKRLINPLKNFGNNVNFSMIDLRFKNGATTNPKPFWLKLLPKPMQSEIVRKSRDLLNRLPPSVRNSKLLSFTSTIAKYSHLITFATSPFIELPASIKMVEQRMQSEQRLSPSKIRWYGLAATLDAASFGIVRGYAKMPTLLMSQENANNYSEWIDENINAGKATDKLFEIGVRTADRLSETAAEVSENINKGKEKISGVLDKIKIWK